MPTMICGGRRDRYEVLPAAGAWLVQKVTLAEIAVATGDAVRFRTAEVATAYATACAVLERYFAALSAQGDCADLFDEWRRLDDAFERLSDELRDPPRSPADDRALSEALTLN